MEEFPGNMWNFARWQVSKYGEAAVGTRRLRFAFGRRRPVCPSKDRARVGGAGGTSGGEARGRGPRGEAGDLRSEASGSIGDRPQHQYRQVREVNTYGGISGEYVEFGRWQVS